LGTVNDRRLPCAQVGDRLEDLFAVVVVRYELDVSRWQKALTLKHVMVVDAIAFSPSVPDHLRGLLHAALVQCILELGETHSMAVTFIEEFDV
jgi:hypothetical protein